MTTEPNDAAFARPHSVDTDGGEFHREAAEGLTKREYFAAMALQGLMAYPGEFATNVVIERLAVESADRLIAELNARRNSAIASIMEELKP